MRELMIALDAKSRKPLYEQIYDYMKREMLEGTIVPGERLPSARALSGFLGVSRSTTDLAYDQLQAEGYIKSEPRKGYFAADVRLLYGTEFSEVPKQAAGNTWINQKHDISTRKIDGKSKNEKAGNSDIPSSNSISIEKYRYDFNLNDVDTGANASNLWKKISRRVFQEDTGELFRQGCPEGDEELRLALRDYLFHARGVRCSADQILVGAGNDYLLMILSNLLGTQSVLAFENPTYKSASDTMRILGHEIRCVRMDDCGMSVESLEESKADVAYVMPSHQFPLGIVMPVERRIQLLDWAAKKDGRYIIEDDYDSEFRYVGKPIPALQGIDPMEKVIYMGTFSKSISPATRISYMVLPKELVERRKAKGHFYAQTVSRMDQKIIRILLTEGYFERHLNRMRSLYKNKQELMVAKLQNSNQFLLSGDNAGLHIVLTFQDGQREENLMKKAAGHSMRIYGSREYQIQPISESQPARILLGYGGLDLEELEKMLSILLDKVL